VVGWKVLGGLDFPGAEHGNRLFDKKILDLKFFVVEKNRIFY